MSFKKKPMKTYTWAEVQATLQAERDEIERRRKTWSPKKRKRIDDKEELKFRKRYAKDKLNYIKRLYDFLINRPEAIKVATPYVISDEMPEWTDVFMYDKNDKAIFVFTLSTPADWKRELEEAKEFGYGIALDSETLLMDEGDKIDKGTILKYAYRWFRNYYSDFFSDDLAFVWDDRQPLEK